MLYHILGSEGGKNGGKKMKSGERGRGKRNTRGTERKKKNLKGTRAFIEFHSRFSYNTMALLYAVILGMRYKQETFPGRIFFKVNSETNI